MSEKFRVIAHGMHETELNAAEQVLAESVRTEAFVMGDADEEQITQLTNQGLIVQKIAEPADGGQEPLEDGAAGVDAGPGLESLSVEPAIDLSTPAPFLIRINGPLLEDYSKALIALGVSLRQSNDDGCYLAWLSQAQVASVRDLTFVRSVRLYGAERKSAARQIVQESVAASASPPMVPMLTFDLRARDEQSLPSLVAWLRQQNIPIAGTSSRKVRIYALEGDTILTAIRARNEVLRVDLFVPPRLCNDRAREILSISQGMTDMMPYDGTDEIIAIADTGIDSAHPDIAPQLIAAIALGRPGDTSDPHGHGTHVSGSALGTGAASAGAFKGTAPNARLVFQSLLDSSGGLGGLPIDLGDMFEEAYGLGGRIHSNSWGAPTFGTYTINSDEVDEFVTRRRDMLVVIAAGNEGQAANRLNAQSGYVDWLSISSPATAKNALTVGASRSDRTTGGYSEREWGQAWYQNFPDPPIAIEKVSGDPESLAAFSSRGPSDDRRIKPDVVAPGTDIVSAKSAIAPLLHYWGPYQPNPQYAYMGGTSMATPLVSGCAALVRQYYRQVRQHEPSAALVRATLINGTRWLSGTDANGSNPAGTVPPANFDQGFGRIDMAQTLPRPAVPNFQLVFSDDWQDTSVQLAATGARKRFTVSVQPDLPLRICMAYTDIPGRALQNNLNLFIQTPSGQKLTGNSQLLNSLGLPDVDNNVEVVRIATPEAGTYLIQISASNLLKGPQDFALVVTGALSSALQPI